MALTDSFLLAGERMSQRLGIHWPHLLMVMNRESRINSHARNPSSLASGLIQNTDLPGIGWTGTREEFLALSNEQQLPYVERFLSRYKQYNLNSVRRIHQALFLPATLSEGDSPSLVLLRQNGTRWNGQEAVWYTSHKQLDIGNKGYITLGDVEKIDIRDAAYPNSPYQQAIARLKSLGRFMEQSTESSFPLIATLAVGAATAYYFYSRRGV